MLLLFHPATLLAEESAGRGHNPGGTVDSLIFGVELALLGMAIVFVGLLAVYLFMTVLRRTIARQQIVRAAGTAPLAAPPELTAEVVHAIALALYMDLRTFAEDDSDEITIHKITRPFSPWMDSSKTALIARNQMFGKRQ
jgi:Na+-transporting methylmalonyl-CoA/oxaloacetate decarboxylase gamma subunit